MVVEISHKVTHVETSIIENELLAKAVKQQLSSTNRIKILEAGCGRRWTLDLSGYDYHLTGIDFDKDALEARITTQKDLHEVIHGDLHNVTLPHSHYDMVFNSYVLEHVDGARKILDEIFQWLKPDGILVLRIPDRASVFGFCTRLTPHKLHILYSRYIDKQQDAGKPGQAPYPTIYNQIVSRKGIYDYCSEHDHKILEEYVLNEYIKSFGPITPIVKIIVKIIEIISMGKLASDHNALTFVIKRNPNNKLR